MRSVIGRAGRLFAMVALVVSLVLLGVVSPALASPKGIFSQYSQCPLAQIRSLGLPPGVALCAYDQTMSGELAIGSARVPIDQTIAIQGGAVPTGNPEVLKEYFLLPAANGESISKTELNVPGGLLGFMNCEEIKGRGIWTIVQRWACRALFERNRANEVTATVESVAAASNPAILNVQALDRETGTALTLPVRVHLKNPLLGNSCYIGSESTPIQLHLTTGATAPVPPNNPIHGAEGEPETLEENGITMLRDNKNSLVDNTFSVPKAEGCGGFLSFIIDPLLDNKLKLPSADGNNTAILNGTLNAATTEAVEASEK